MLTRPTGRNVVKRLVRLSWRWRRRWRVFLQVGGGQHRNGQKSGKFNSVKYSSPPGVANTFIRYNASTGGPAAGRSGWGSTGRPQSTTADTHGRYWNNGSGIQARYRQAQRRVVALWHNHAWSGRRQSPCCSVCIVTSPTRHGRFGRRTTPSPPLWLRPRGVKSTTNRV